jgi:cell division septal protein FtsQ
MFFRRKSRNRRLEREYVLDVKLRSGQVRAARTRMLTVGLGGLFAFVFAVYLIWRLGGWALDRMIYENKAFAMKTLDVQTDGIISVDQLRRWAAVQPEQNLIALDLARVKRDLELIPYIQSVSVERILPHTLRIRVSEREPIAQINVPRLRPVSGIDFSVWQLDPGGWVMPPLEPRQRAATPNSQGDQLPLISFPHSDHVQPGQRILMPQVQAALQLVVDFERSPMVGLADLRRIDATAPDVLVVTTGQGSEVTFAFNDLDQQLRRWHEVFDQALRVGKAIATLDLAVSNNVPARWLEASAVAPTTPRLPKPLRSKKKHV